MIKELCIVGHPLDLEAQSVTELDHQIHCWQAGDLSNWATRRKLQSNEDRGTRFISICNGEFLKNVKQIKAHARSQHL